MKSSKLIAIFLLMALILSACWTPSEENIAVISTGGTVAEYEINTSSSDPMQKRVEQRCEEIVSLYYDLYISADKTEPESKWEDALLSQSSIDTIENLLVGAGLDVMDTNGEYPSYLTTAENFYEFWDAVQNQQAAEQEIIVVRENGALAYRLFTYQDGVFYVYSMSYPVDGDSDFNYEKHEVLDCELTDRGNFYYRIYPAGDKHYADFFLIRMEAPNLELWDLNMKYIWAGGYIGTNMFLTDWTENDFNELSFNDLWEYLYYDYHGIWPNGYTFIPDQYSYQIPAVEFEKVILQYFNIDLDTLREMSQYDAEGDCYPFRPIETNDYVFLYYYTVESEVTAYCINPDGTITLTVEMLSTDLKMDCLFAHEVTIRPLENGQFQYVSNKITYQTEFGLPFCEPRLTWDET